MNWRVLNRRRRGRQACIASAIAESHAEGRLLFRFLTLPPPCLREYGEPNRAA
jgi:hypothetical protein